MGRGEEYLAEDQMPTTLEAFAAYFKAIPRSRVALEVGTHSPWVSNLLEGLGHEVYVANPRKMESIRKNKRKNDKKDARTLTRLVRADPQLLHPIRHRGIQAREDLILLRARDALVGARTKLINCVRGLVKSVGGRVPKCCSESFARQAVAAIPESIRETLLPIVEQIAAMTVQIRKLEGQVKRMAGKKYPETALLKQVDGVGDLTSLAYILTLDNPERFAKSREVGPYLGLVPRQDDSGESSKQLRITKDGRHDGEEAADRERAIHPGSIRARQRPPAIWSEACRAGREERQEEGGDGRDTQACGVASQAVGDG